MSLNPGDTLLNGQYQILHQLGRGGFGFVYLALETPLNEQVAIKELIPALVGDETVLKRFLAEAKATRRLTHEHIVRTHHIFGEGGNYYIVMEYMPGGTLEERLRQHGPLPVDQATQLAVDVCDGLGYAHARGVVHCDLKPANILFSADGSAKVADFGIAYVSDQMLTRSWLTPAGFMAGTLPYMSPEQTDGVRDDPRIDIYALGAVLYRALTGRAYLDFDQRDTPRAQADNVQRIYTNQPIPPSRHNPHIPAWLDGVVLKALAKQPEARFADTAGLRAALLQQTPISAPTPHPAQAAQAQTRPASPRPQPSPQAPSQPARPSRAPSRALLWTIVGVAAALLLAIVIAVVMLASGAGDGRKAGIPPPPPTIAVQATPNPTAFSEAPAPTPRPTNPPIPTTTPPPTAAQEPGISYRIGINPEFPDFEFLDDSGKLVGFDPDLLTAIAEAAGFQFEFVSAEWDGLLNDLVAGKYDAVISGVTITRERAEVLDFSTPYFNAGLVIVVRAADRNRITGPGDLDGLKVGVDQDTFSDTWISENTASQVVRYNGPYQPFEALDNGDLDAVVSDNVMAIMIIRYTPGIDATVVGEPVVDEMYGIAVNKDRQELLQAINQGLATIRANGTYDQIYETWFGLP